MSCLSKGRYSRVAIGTMAYPTPAPTNVYDRLSLAGSMGETIAMIVGVAIAGGCFVVVLFYCILRLKKRMKPIVLSARPIQPERKPYISTGKQSIEMDAVGTSSLLTTKYNDDFAFPQKPMEDHVKAVPSMEVKIINKAFIFIKPHANVVSTQAFVRDWLYSKGLVMVEERTLTGPSLVGCFDRQYALTGRRALILKPHELDLSASNKTLFHDRFGVTWEEALEKGRIRNASSAMDMLAVSSAQLSAAWLKSVADGNVVRFGRGFYCGLLQNVGPDRPSVFCINGFYPAMRAKFAAPTASIYACSVLFDEKTLPWKEFIEYIVGVADPNLAHPESLRGVMCREWKELGLSAVPNSEENCLHASASAFEAFAERCNWLKAPWTIDPVGSRLFALGMTPHVVQEWLNNSVVKGKRVFEHMAGAGCEECLDIAKQIFSIADVAHIPGTIKGGRSLAAYAAIPEEPVLRRNSAFFYFKPGANNPSVIEFVRDWFVGSGFLITDEGDITPVGIEKGNIVDKMYADIGKKAYIKKPNALTALNVNPQELNDAWNRAFDKGLVVKFERGFYCGLLDTIPNKGSIFCVNGFFMQMRAKYLTATIHYINIEWEQSLMSWDHFRRIVIGSSNIKSAPSKSLRAIFYSEWKSFGIVSAPNIQDNCVHGSASAFEAFVERTIWLHVPYDSDPFAKKLMASGITLQCLREWAINPVIAGKKVFQHFENLGTDECIEKALELYSAHTGISRAVLAKGVTSPLNGYKAHGLTTPATAGRLPPLHELPANYRRDSLQSPRSPEQDITDTLKKIRPNALESSFDRVDHGNDTTVPSSGYDFLSRHGLTRGHSEQLINRPPRKRDFGYPHTAHAETMPVGDYDYYFPSRDDALSSGLEETYPQQINHRHRTDNKVPRGVGRAEYDDRPRVHQSHRRPQSHNAVETHGRGHSGARRHRQRPWTSRHGENRYRESEDAQNNTDEDDFPYRHYGEHDERQEVRSPTKRRRRRSDRSTDRSADRQRHRSRGRESDQERESGLEADGLRDYNKDKARDSRDDRNRRGTEEAEIERKPNDGERDRSRDNRRSPDCENVTASAHLLSRSPAPPIQVVKPVETPLDPKGRKITSSVDQPSSTKPSLRGKRTDSYDRERVSQPLVGTDNREPLNMTPTRVSQGHTAGRDGPTVDRPVSALLGRDILPSVRHGTLTPMELPSRVSSLSPQLLVDSHPKSPSAKEKLDNHRQSWTSAREEAAEYAAPANRKPSSSSQILVRHDEAETHEDAPLKHTASAQRSTAAPAGSEQRSLPNLPSSTNPSPRYEQPPSAREESSHGRQSRSSSHQDIIERTAPRSRQQSSSSLTMSDPVRHDAPPLIREESRSNTSATREYQAEAKSRDEAAHPPPPEPHETVQPEEHQDKRGGEHHVKDEASLNSSVASASQHSRQRRYGIMI